MSHHLLLGGTRDGDKSLKKQSREMGQWCQVAVEERKKTVRVCGSRVLCLCGKTDETDHQKKNNTNNKKRTVVPQKRDGCLPNALVCFFQYDILFGGPCFFVDIGV